MAMDTRFETGSVSKWIAAMVVDQSKLARDAPILRYLPDYRADTGARLTLGGRKRAAAWEDGSNGGFRLVARRVLADGVGVVATDVVIVAVAMADAAVIGRVIGAVRLCSEHGVRVLRGMQVARDYRQLGVSQALLAACDDVLGENVAYCLPYAHLAGSMDGSDSAWQHQTRCRTSCKPG